MEERSQIEPDTKEYCCLCCNEVDESATLLDMTDKKQGLEYICYKCKDDYSHCNNVGEIENEVADQLKYLELVRQDIKHYKMKYKHGNPFKAHKNFNKITNEQFDKLTFHPHMKIKLEDEKIYPVTSVDWENKEFTIKKNEHLYAKIHCSICEIVNSN